MHRIRVASDGLKSKGGVVFSKAVAESLKLKSFVRSRALKNMSSAEPVKVAAVIAEKERKINAGPNKQKTLNSVKKNFSGPKDQSWRWSQTRQLGGGPCEV